MRSRSTSRGWRIEGVLGSVACFVLESVPSRWSIAWTCAGLPASSSGDSCPSDTAVRSNKRGSLHRDGTGRAGGWLEASTSIAQAL